MTETNTNTDDLMPSTLAATENRVLFQSPDHVVCLDAECGNYDQLWITTSLRGIVPGALTVKVLEEGQHSGMSGGIVPSSFRIMRQLMERVENAETGAVITEMKHVRKVRRIRERLPNLRTIVVIDGKARGIIARDLVTGEIERHRQ